MIVSDDQRFGSMAHMPLTRELIFERGVRFPNAYVTTPVCCPSRASILTGDYAHTHGVRNNSDDLLEPTVAQHLDLLGYRTGLVGKYLNSWDGRNRSEFDTWVSFPYGDARFEDPSLVYGDSRPTRTEGYITDLLRDAALDFIDRADGSGEPFFLLFTPSAPHRPATPAEVDEGLPTHLALNKSPAWNESDVSDKPAYVQETPPLNGSEIETLEAWSGRMTRSLASLDRAVAALVQHLEIRGLLEDTLVVYLSDNGFLWGEHRLKAKDKPYQEAVRVPFAVRYPPLTDEGAALPALVANIDIAPTIYDVIGVTPPEPTDGRSLLPVLEGRSEGRKALLLEGWPQTNWTAVHTGDVVYVDNDGQLNELYDLTKDPHQLDNLVATGTQPELEERMQKLLEQKRGETGAPGTSG